MEPREEHAFLSMNCRDKANAPNLLTEYEMSHRPRCLTEKLFNCIASSKLGSTVCCTEKTPKKVWEPYWSCIENYGIDDIIFV